MVETIERIRFNDCCNDARLTIESSLVLFSRSSKSDLSSESKNVCTTVRNNRKLAKCTLSHGVILYFEVGSDNI